MLQIIVVGAQNEVTERVALLTQVLFAWLNATLYVAQESCRVASMAMARRSRGCRMKKECLSGDENYE